MNKTTWQRVKLGEVAEILSSKRIFYSEYVKFGIPFYRSKEIIDKALKKPLNECLYISYDRFNEIKEKYGVPINGDILISAVGERSGIAYLVNNDGDFYFKDGNLIWLKNFSNNLNGKYLVYWFQSRIGQSILENIMIGSAQKALTIQGMKELVLDIPPIETQRKIAEILSSLDDKIDLLHRQNKTLESLALTLFRHTFIDNPKRNEWQIGKLGEEFDFTMGVSPEGNSYNEDIQGMPMFQGNADFGFRFPNNRIYTTKPKRLAQLFDTLISVRAPVGELNMAKETCCIGRGLAAFRHKQDSNLYSYTYYKLHSLLNEIKQFNDTGTVFGAISKKDFESIAVAIPPLIFVKTLNQQLKVFDDKIYNNVKQIQNLESLRDIMLPKLLSGEIEV